jgi:hypothetical protein
MNTIVDLRKEKQKRFDAQKWTSLSLEILGVDNITVYLVDAVDMKNDDYVFYGISEKLVMPDSYRLYILPSASISTKKDVICHECIHIKQYQEGRLRIKDKYTLVFENREYYPPYNPKQPHEIEAFGGQKQLRKKVNGKF